MTATSFTPDEHLKLKFEHERMEGLEIVLRWLSILEVFDLEDVFNRPVNTRAEAREQAKDLCALLAKHIVSWNWNDHATKKKVPITADGLLSRDFGRIMLIVRSYLDQVTEVPAPLAGPSKSGAPFPEASIPMETLSPSPDS